MANMETRLRDLATTIGTQCKVLRTLINGNALDNSALITTVKTNLVAAINEVKTQANTLATTQGARINDASTSSATETYSINKIKSELSNTAAVVKNEILAGAGPAFDTLKELQDLLTGEQSAIDAINTALGNRVRTDTAAQGLTSTQKQNARTNIEAFGAPEIGNPDTDFAMVFTGALQ